MRRLSLCGALLALAIGLGGPMARAEGFKSGVFDPPHAAPDFELQGSDGAPVSVARFKGKVVVMAFGFTYCQRICPITLAKLSEVFRALGPLASEIQVLFITVNPDRDSPARLREFLEFFNPGFIGATGTPRQLQQVRADYGVFSTRVASDIPKLGYEMHHSSSLYVIDRQGRLRLLTPFSDSAADVAHDLKLLLNS